MVGLNPPLDFFQIFLFRGFLMNWFTLGENSAQYALDCRSKHLKINNYPG